jgi:glucokinase
MTDSVAMSYAIGMDLGGSSVKAIAVRPEGTILHRRTFEFDPDQPMEWASQMREYLGILEKEQGAPAASVGVSAPGLAAPDGRSVAFMPGRLQGLEGLDWTEYLGRPGLVPVLNDAQAALLGEWWMGAARGFRHCLLLTLGTGVGGAAMVDGQLLRGKLGRAGHLGHVCLDPDGPPDVCGAPGSLEVAIGNCTIRERSRGRFKTTHELVSAFEGGDPWAREVWLRSVKNLSCAIASFVNVLDPEAIIIGGGIARAGDALFKPLEEFLDPIEWRPGGARVRILPARLGELAGAYGAACLGLRGGRLAELNELA